MPRSKSPLRFGLLAAACWLATLNATFAQDAAGITLKLSPADAEITRLIDLQPIGDGKS
jgi:hypothetical protein